MIITIMIITLYHYYYFYYYYHYAAPSGSILNLSLGQWTFPVAKSALSQWQPGPTFKEHKASV